MITRRPAFLAVLLCVLLGTACKKPAPQPGKPAAAGPQVRATVVTLKTTLQPGDKTFTRTLVIAGKRARNTGEQDVWHFYDTEANTITFVDDVAKTFRTEPLASIARQRRTSLARSLPSHYPELTLKRTGKKRSIQNVTAEQSVIEAGAYKRELWLADHPAIPRTLFALMHAAEGPVGPLAPMMKDADEALLNTRGFPLLDHAEIAFGRQKMMVERSVVSIGQQEVGESVLAVPKGYRDVTPKPAGAKKRP
ncbi:MAG TPA: hypothetical protein VEK57_00025 [Thermoanaerobaculia bacterium]|nr:hypothetical protein [Thermoanaerobaculia bacterium]